MSKEIKAIECRFAVHMPALEAEGDDYHLVKEKVHYIDGTEASEIKFIKNYQRSFWITKKGAQNHKEKKEAEKLENLTEYQTTQSSLRDNIARALGKVWSKETLRDLCNSPYVYGSDILSTALIKNDYKTKYPDTITKYSVATYDIETDVFSDDYRILMATITLGTNVFTAVVNSFLDGMSNPEFHLKKTREKYLIDHKNTEGKVLYNYNDFNFETVFVDSEIDVVKACFSKLHEWKPDFLSIWNMDFDIPRTVEAIERAGLSPADIFSDPSVPRKRRFFRYKQGSKQKVTASGKVTPISPANQWHTVFCPSSFYVIDAMCTYRKIRLAKAEEPSYSLDAILNKELKIGKLKFTEADGYVGLAHHAFMQTNYKLEYIVYNIFDCIGMQLLDDKIKDLSITLPMSAANSDFYNFHSSPRRTVDKLHFWYLDNFKMVYASTGSTMTVKADSETLDLSGWIVALPAELVAENGLKCIIEDPDLVTNIYRDVADLDVAAAYPNNQIVFNVSKATTVKEVVRIEGVSMHTAKMQTINFSSGQTNALEFCQTMLGFPTSETLLEMFVNRNNSNVLEEL